MYYIQNLPGIAEELFLSPPIIWKSVLECVLLSLGISPLHFLFWDFLDEDMCANDSKKNRVE